MCTPALLLELNKGLTKGSFPLLTLGTQPQWECLLRKLEDDAEDYVSHIANHAEKFPSTFALSAADFSTGFGDAKTFLCYMHKHLSKDFGVATRAPWQGYIQRLRKLMVDDDLMEESTVQLIKSPHTGMGGGLTGTEVSLIPDPSLGVAFGSTPNQAIIAAKAECWRVVKQRTYEDMNGALGKKPHYVLAHLLNHQLNGSGQNELNVLPFWAAANTLMASTIERHVKDAVNMGVVVSYVITCGPIMGLNPTYAAWATTAKGNAKQMEIIEWEHKLPQFLNFSATATNGAGTTINIVPPGTILNNYVPMTLPTL